MTEESR